MNDKSVPSDAKRYELMVILNADIGNAGIDTRLEAIRKLLTSPGEIFHEELWGAKNLAYPIKKQKQGYYAVFDFVTGSDRLKEMNLAMELEPEILRHFITVLPLSYEAKDYTLPVKEENPAEAKNDRYAGRRYYAGSRNESKDMVSKPAETTPVKSKSPAKPEEGDKKLHTILENPDLNF